MSLISDYGGIKPSIITYQPYKETIETISGLFLQYLIIEEEYIQNGIIYHFFKKSLWGKKQMGFLTLEYLPGQHINDLLTSDDTEPIHPYSDILIGAEYGSEYSSVNWTGMYQTFNLQSPNKQVLSLGLLIANIEAGKDVFRTLQADEFNNAGDMMMLNTTRMNYLRKNIELLDTVKSKLKVFDKFLIKSSFQPAPNEQQQL
ncbi:hypothetical protein [Mucilaginibacter sp. HD30]